jgi:Rad3-related DNA helicase
MLIEVQDIEEFVAKGRRLGTCSYYGAREALPFADLVCLPYNSILHRTTRESLGISLKGNVLIIDEAHNIVDAINNMYSVTITSKDVREQKYNVDPKNVVDNRNAYFFFVQTADGCSFSTDDLFGTV